MGMYITDKTQENSKNVFLWITLCTWTLDIEIPHTEGKHGYASICCIAISKLSFREELY